MTAPGWKFDNSYARLPDGLFTRLPPTPVAAPGAVIVNHRLAEQLGLDLAGLPEGELAAVFAGNTVPDGADPIAQAYAGHQFGGFNILGDGRAIVLGEHLAPDGRRVDIQLKGSGPTPYSRRGDGRAALGPMLREYIISEAMAGLGIPTTRSLAVAATGEPVYREQILPGAVLTRIAASHLRVGTFEFAIRQGPDALQALVAYAIDRHYPDLADADNPALALLDAVIDRQADLIVEWMRVGFIHGVMNTDNMTISGETIDYGPCAFMDAYDPDTVFSSIDLGGRYAFGRQPKMAQWNLARFAECLLPLLAADPDAAVALAEDRIKSFESRYRLRWQAMMGAKLGLAGFDAGDSALIEDLLAWMRAGGFDYTNGFAALTEDSAPPGADPVWLERWRARRGDMGPAQARMRAANPVYIPRNHRVEAALAAAGEGDLAPLTRLLEVLSAPYERRAGLEEYESPPPEGAPAYETFCGT